MITPLRPAARPAARPQPAAFFTPQAGQPAETVELSRPAPSQQLWREVNQLGLWTSLAGVTPPLGSVLSQAAQGELTRLLTNPALKFGFSLDPSSPQMAHTPWEGREAAQALLTWDDPQGRFDRLNLVSESANFAPINSFQQLQAMEAMLVTADLASLPNPGLARRLLDLESAGARFEQLHRGEKELRRNNCRSVGSYGAYQAWPDERLLINRVPLANERDLQTAEFFLLGRRDAGLEADVRARTLRELEREGFSFLRGEEQEPVDALAAYRYAVLDQAGDVRLCLEGMAPETLLSGGDQLHPVSPRLKELMAFARAHFQHVPPREGTDLLKALTCPGQLPLSDRWEVLQALRQHESSSGSALLAFQQVLGATAPGEHPRELVPEYRELRERGLALDKAGEALGYFHHQLPSLTYGPEDFRQERAALVELAQVTGDLPEALQARALLTLPGPEPYADRLEAFKVVKKPQQYQTLVEAQLPLGDSARALARLSQEVGEPEARQAFAYLARGVQKKVFSDLDQGVERYLRERSVAREPGLARELCLSPEPFEARQRAGAALATAEDFRAVWEGPHERLEQDARSLVELHELLPADAPTARALFRRYRGERVEEVRRELELYPDVELMERALQGDFGASYPARERAAALVQADYPMLLRQHRPEASLEDEARALSALRGALPGPEGTQVYQFLQERLRHHPEETVQELAQEFLSDYLVTGDLPGCLGRVGQRTEKAHGGVGQQGDSVVVGGVRVPRREESARP